MPGPGTKKAEDVSGLLVEIRDNTRTMAIKLFGSTDPDDENNTGRLPKLEEDSEQQAKKIEGLEKKVNRVWDRLVMLGMVGVWVVEHYFFKKG